MRVRELMALGLVALIGQPPRLTAQQQQLMAQAQAGDLKIVVAQGEGARNNIRARSATQPVVIVEDAAGKLVAGAEVVFQLPPAGPGGVFNGWLLSQTVRTNAEGRAAASGFTPNSEAGRFNIKVTATHEKRTASAVIAQVNVQGAADSGSGRSGAWKWWLAAGAAAAIAGGVAASRGDGDTTPASVANPVVITPGVITVGGPR